jgi:hypothetical protein
MKEMDVYQGLAATVGLGTTLWNAWRSLKTFLDEAEHIDETFVELQRLVTLLHSAFLSVDATASARSRAYEQNEHSATIEERLIVERLCESRAHCEATIMLLRDTVKSIKPPNKGSRISHSEFIRKCREQWRNNERKPTMERFLKTMDTHLQTQQLFLVCLLKSDTFSFMVREYWKADSHTSLGQTEMGALRSEIRSLIDGLRQQRPPGQANLPSPPASPTSPRSFSGSISNGSVADPVYGLMVQALPQCDLDNAKSEMLPTLWAYAILAVQGNDVSVLEQVLEQDPDLIKLADADKWTLFHQAVQSLAESSDTTTLKCLVQHLPKERGTESDVINAVCKAGKTPIFFAVEHRCPEALELLVKAGADVNTADNGGLTPLESAYEGSDLNIMSILIKNGAYVDEKMMKKLSSAQRKLLPTREGQEQNSSKKATKRKGSFQKVPSQESESDIQTVEPKQLRKSLSFGFRRPSTSSKTSIRRSSTISTV